MGTTELQDDVSKIVAASGDAAASQMARKVVGPEPTPAGPGGNVASDGVPFPAAGDGDGSGRHGKSVIGQTKGKTMPAGVKSFPQGGFLSQTGRK
jgi:hypothetical protein